ncbi:MAG: succinate dehydrogenase/fumarate reductase iron-sulfur subunit [Alphaproteobacteria bacterium]
MAPKKTKTAAKKKPAPAKKVVKTMAKAAKKAATKPAKKVAVKKVTPTKKTVAKSPAPSKAKVLKKALSQKTAQKKNVIKASAQPSTKPTAKPAAKPVAKPAAKAAPSAAKKTIVLRIMRGSKIAGKLVQRTQDFTVPYDGSTTVLIALEYIKGKIDGTLTFRRSCRASICGSCGMFIDNRSRLACKTKIEDLVNGNMVKNIAPIKGGIITVGPQKNIPVLKDLVVDISHFYKKVHAIKPYVQEGKEADKNVNKQSFEQVNLVSNCIMCGSCVSDCTMMVENPNFMGPAALAKAYRFVADPREGDKTARLQALSEKDGIWDCVRCGMCVDSCPKDVAPMEAIVKLREKAIHAGITANAGARHALVFKNDIATWGILNEPFMLLKTLRLGVLGQIGNALNLMSRGKVPNPFPFHEKPKNLHEISAIYKALEKNPIDVATRAEDTGPGAG